jgi:hypothetical protein
MRPYRVQIIEYCVRCGAEVPPDEGRTVYGLGWTQRWCARCVRLEKKASAEARKKLGRAVGKAGDTLGRVLLIAVLTVPAFLVLAFAAYCLLLMALKPYLVR